MTAQHKHQSSYQTPTVLWGPLHSSQKAVEEDRGRGGRQALSVALKIEDREQEEEGRKALLDSLILSPRDSREGKASQPVSHFSKDSWRNEKARRISDMPSHTFPGKVLVFALRYCLVI